MSAGKLSKPQYEGFEDATIRSKIGASFVSCLYAFSYQAHGQATYCGIPQ